MARDPREMPRGLVAPLSQAQLASLRGVSDGALKDLPEEHRKRLLDLGLLTESEAGLGVTELGRERLVSDR
ncbi:MAG TPA: hypothetical protein VMI56_15750 [Reyranella sp.]|nr:hypothetical protein [Reyranella sp.]